MYCNNNSDLWTTPLFRMIYLLTFLLRVTHSGPWCCRWCWRGRCWWRSSSGGGSAAAAPAAAAPVSSPGARPSAGPAARVSLSSRWGSVRLSVSVSMSVEQRHLTSSLKWRLSSQNVCVSSKTQKISCIGPRAEKRQKVLQSFVRRSKKDDLSKVQGVLPIWLRGLLYSLW